MSGSEILFLNEIVSVIDGHYATVLSSENNELIIPKYPSITVTLFFYRGNDNN